MSLRVAQHREDRSGVGFDGALNVESLGVHGACCHWSGVGALCVAWTIMTTMASDDPIAVAAVSAIQTGDVASLDRLLGEHPELVVARISPGEGCGTRTLLHVVTDWPGHFPNGAACVAVLVSAGADVNARFDDRHTETPLHWAASSDDVEVLDALLDAGADIEADGAVIAGGTPLTDATAFGQWNAARRLLERGARATMWEAATMGLADRVEAYLSADPPPSPEEVTRAFWARVTGVSKSQPSCSATVVPTSIGSAGTSSRRWTPQPRSEAPAVVEWLRGIGARSATDVRPS